jgi:hypothetical protein
MQDRFVNLTNAATDEYILFASGASGLSDLSGSATRGALSAAGQQALATADKYAARIADGTLRYLPGDQNWGYDPKGNLNIAYWLGTGRDPGASPLQFTANLPDGYAPVIGTSATATWRGSGKSPAQREVEAAQASAQAAAEQAAQAAAAQAQAAAAQAAAQKQGNIAMQQAITQAQILAKQNQFEQAQATLNTAQAQLPAGVDPTPLVNALAALASQQQAAQEAAKTQQQAQSDLDDALTAARTYARKGNFDNAQAMLDQATRLARSVPGGSGQVNAAQMFVSDMQDKYNQQQQAAQAAKDAQAQASAGQTAQLQFQQSQLQIQAQMEQARLQAQQAAAQAAADREAARQQAQADQQQQAMQMFMMMRQQQQAPAAYGPPQGYSGGGAVGPAPSPDQPMGPPPVDYGRQALPEGAATTNISPGSEATDVAFQGETAGGGDYMGYLGAHTPMSLSDQFAYSGMGFLSDEVKTARAQAKLDGDNQKKWLLLGGVGLGLLALYRYRTHGRIF